MWTDLVFTTRITSYTTMLNGSDRQVVFLLSMNGTYGSLTFFSMFSGV